MIGKWMPFSSFSRAIQSASQCFRPDKEQELIHWNLPANVSCLPRGKGLSYNDCCLNTGHILIDTTRLNRLLAFDESNGRLICEGGVTFADLFLVHKDFIPPVIPGTLQATLAGGIANDVHGKNNPLSGTLGQHLLWFDVFTGHQLLRCSRQENPTLFQATIAGLGLTGVITRVALSLKKAPRYVKVRTIQQTHWDRLLQQMASEAHQYDYQVAWLDFLNPPQARLSQAKDCTEVSNIKERHLRVPPLPFRMISKSLMQRFNRYYFNKAVVENEIQSLAHFNNPLDSIKDWNRLYGKKGLLQFQAVFDQAHALDSIEKLQTIMHNSNATPTLAVLKYFDQKGSGLLSFAQPGFTMAIDFINNHQAQQAIRQMNQLITMEGGKIYLAKDLFLTQEQFISQYPQYQQFKSIISEYAPDMQSDLGRRLGLLS